MMTLRTARRSWLKHTRRRLPGGREPDNHLQDLARCDDRVNEEETAITVARTVAQPAKYAVWPMRRLKPRIINR
jgi:hypothetical protein